jgi:hypothetical protein
MPSPEVFFPATHTLAEFVFGCFVVLLSGAKYNTPLDNVKGYFGKLR